jgi:membrane-associated phospholipid phosphatase
MQNLQPSKQRSMVKIQSLLFFGSLLPLILLIWMLIQLNNISVFNFDMPFMRSVHQFANPVFDQTAITLSYLGGMPSAIMQMLLLVGHSAYTKSKNILFILISIMGSTSISWLLKVLVDRPRPLLWPRLVQDYGASFPSGHSVYAAAFAAILILLFWQTRWRKVVSIFALLWMLLMGISRVYLGVHYPSDVLAGWALGWGWVFLVYVVVLNLKDRSS